MLLCWRRIRENSWVRYNVVELYVVGYAVADVSLILGGSTLFIFSSFSGGRCGSFSVEVEGVGSFRHERGPSLLLLKEEYENLFADCAASIINTAQSNNSGKSAAERYGLHMKQCIPAYQVVFEDGDTIPLGFPRSKCAGESFSVEEIKQIQQLEQESILKLDSLEKNGFQKWQEYLDTCAAFLDCGLPNFIEERLDLVSLPKFIGEALRENAKRWPLQPHSTMLSALFSSPKFIALASFQDLYVGLEPYANAKQFGGGVLRKTAPAVFGLLAALELHPTNKRAGVFAPVGGFRQVAESMHELCLELGVEFRFDTSVTSVTDEGSVYFLKGGADGEKKEGVMSADLVICNADLPYATKTIVSSSTDEPMSQRYDWDDSFDYSSGVIAFHWSVSKSLEALNTHNVFMSADSIETVERSWNVLRDGGAMNTSTLIDQPFNFYVHRACKSDETAAPPGCDSIMVLVPCATLVRREGLASLPREEAISVYKQQFNEHIINDARLAVFRRLVVLEELKDLKEFILDEVVDTPGTYADYYNVGAGVPFGLVRECSTALLFYSHSCSETNGLFSGTLQSHGLGQLSLTRPEAESKTHNNNVLFVGASSRPGNGVPLVLIGAKSVSTRCNCDEVS